MIARLIAAGAVLFVIANMLGLTDESKTESEGPTTTEAVVVSEPAEDVAVSLLPKSYCFQDPVARQVKVGIYLKNTGTTDAKDFNVRVKRIYIDGQEVNPIGDTLTDVDVPAGGKPHFAFHNFGIGADKVLDGCEALLVGGDESYSYATLSSERP